jgi:nucleotide-binding universal stress UspA family protein
MYRTILVPLDGSPFAEHALPLAIALARRAHAHIHLVAVSTPFSAAAFQGVSLGMPELEAELTGHYRTYLEGIAARLGERVNVPITSAVFYGEIAPTLCKLAGSGHYDLVAMATHARSPFGRFWLGSVADEMIHHATLPLLLVRPESEAVNLDEEPDLGRVVVPLDGSALAEAIIDPAIALAGLIPDVEIVLVRAIAATPSEEAADVADSLTWTEAQRYLDHIAARLQARGLRVRTHVVFDDKPAEAILDEIKDEHAGLVALETHGRGGLSRLLHGSVAEKVVRGAHIPVLIHRPVKAGSGSL